MALGMSGGDWIEAGEMSVGGVGPENWEGQFVSVGKLQRLR